jgi:hypothetical protein
MRFGQMQGIEQERAVDGNLVRLAHRLEILLVNARTGAAL